MKNVLAIFAASIILQLGPMPLARAADIPLDSWGRHPVNIYLSGRADVARLQALGVGIEELREGYAEAAVRPEMLKKLLALGWRVEPRKDEPVPLDIVQAYHDYAWLSAKLDSVHNDYPDITKKVSIGTSVQGRQLLAFLVSDHPDSSENEAEVRFAANMHGDEVVGKEICLAMIDSLTQAYGTEPEITGLVDSREIWFMPLLNPDGNNSVSRYNAHGEDLNRDYPVPDGGANGGYVAGTEAEVTQFMSYWSTKRVVLSLNYHGGAMVANYPWDYTYTLCPDDALAREVSLGYSRLNPPMYNSAEFDSGVTNGAAWYVVRGSLQDWSYHWTSGLDITVEIGTKWPSASTLPAYWSDNRSGMLYFIRQAGWGLQGVVTDSLTGQPVGGVSVDVGGIGKAVFTDAPAGDYHRMLMTGYYDITFSKPGYLPKAASGLRVRRDSLTEQNFLLVPIRLSGTVRDSASSAPIDGAVVEVAGAGQDTTDSLGGYSIHVPAGTYTVTFSAYGHTTRSVANVLIDGLDTLDVALGSWIAFNYIASDTVAIPDGGPWVEDSLFIDREISLADYEFYLNIDHGNIGDLEVKIFQPGGDSMRLHDRSGAGADLIGWYDSQLKPADSLRWGAWIGYDAYGYWRLRARDWASGSAGTLRSWGIQAFSTDTGVEGRPEDPAGAPQLALSSRPNPFRTSAVISYLVPYRRATKVELSVYNIMGQRVRSLADGVHSPAKYLMVWDGRDDKGGRVPAGVYLVRLAAENSTATKKMILIR